VTNLVGTPATATGTTTLSPAWSGDQPRQNGRLLIALVTTQNNASVTQSCTTPAGWSLENQGNRSNGTARSGTWFFVKFATGGDAAPTFTLNASAEESWCVLLEVRGLAVSASLGAVEDRVFTSGGSTTTTIAVGAAGAVAHAPDMILAFVGGRSTASGQTETWNNGFAGVLSSAGSGQANLYGTLGMKEPVSAASETPSVTLGNNTGSSIVAIALKKLEVVTAPLTRVGEPTYGGGTANAAPSVTLPQTPTAGHLLTAVVWGNSGSVTQATLSCTSAGWAAGATFVAQTSGVSRLYMRMFWKKAAGTETSVAFSLTNGTSFGVLVEEWSGADLTAPHDADSATAVRAAATGTGVTLTDSITTGGTNRAVYSALVSGGGLVNVAWNSPLSLVNPAFAEVSGGRLLSTGIGTFGSSGANSPAVTFDSTGAVSQAIVSMSFKVMVPIVVAVGAAAEIDAGVAVTRRIRRSVGVAVETDTARALGRVVATGRAVETDTARPVTRKRLAVYSPGPAQAVGSGTLATVLANWAPYPGDLVVLCYSRLADGGTLTVDGLGASWTPVPLVPPEDPGITGYCELSIWVGSGAVDTPGTVSVHSSLPTRGVLRTLVVRDPPSRDVTATYWAATITNTSTSSIDIMAGAGQVVVSLTGSDDEDTARSIAFQSASAPGPWFLDAVVALAGSGQEDDAWTFPATYLGHSTQPSTTGTDVTFAMAMLAVGRQSQVGVAREFDFVEPLVRGHRIVKVAVETDLAIALIPRGHLVAGVATETDTAIALAHERTVAVGVAVEVDAAWPSGAVSSVGVGVAALYADLGDVVEGLPDPVIWWLGSGSARPGDQVSIVGAGFGADQAEFDGAVEVYDWQTDTWGDAPVVSWERVAADPAQAAGDGSVDEVAKTATPEHGEITLAASDEWRPPGYGLRVRVTG
jgi:hypothetical protein